MPTEVAESAEIIEQKPELKGRLWVEDLSSFRLNLGQILAWVIAG